MNPNLKNQKGLLNFKVIRMNKKEGMHKHRAFLVICILSFITSQLYSEVQPHLNYRFQYFMFEDGLPQNTIICITKDNYGFMWFGSKNGGSRYDSYNFETFEADESNEHALPDNLISAMAAGNDHRVWIGSSKGLSYFDHQAKQISRFIDTNAFGEQITRVNSIVAMNNEIWVGTENHGIYQLQSNGKSYFIARHYCRENNNLPDNQINTIYQSRKNTIFAGGQNGYYIFDSQKELFLLPEASRSLPPQTIINDIFEDTNGLFYFSCSSGLFTIPASTNQLVFYPADITNPLTLQHAMVNMVRQDISGQILVATLEGLQTFHPETGIFQSFPEEGPTNFVLNNQFVSCVYCDTDGNVWIGTEKGGINKFNVFQNRFNFITHNPNNPNSLNESTINSVYKEKNLLWIGTAGGGLNLYNTATDKFYHFTYRSNNTSTISSSYVTSITRGEDQILYVGTWGGGLNALKTQGTQVSIHRITLSDPGYRNDLVDGFVSSLINNPDGYLMIGTQGGLSMLDYRTRKFTTLIAPVNFSHTLSEIGCMLLDKKGFYWIGTRNGLFRFPQNSLRDTKDEDFIISQLEFYKHEPNNASSLPGDYITTLMEDSNGNVWLGTYGNGLAKAVINNAGELVFETFSTLNGLSNNVVYGILNDEHNRLWISTDYGLSMLNTTNNSFRHFYKQDGLLNNQFYWSASYKSPDGVLYFGGIEGLNFFDPEDFYEYNYYPTPKITKFRIYNNEVNPGEKYHNNIVIKKPIYDVDTIFLSYKDNNISFDFSSFDYYLPEKSKYAYMMTGVEKEWVTVPAQRRFASYNNLEGGTYTFLLKASNCDGVWNESPTEITIIVKPPFWKTTWFRIVSFSFVTLLSYLFIMFQMRRIIAQKKLLEEKVQHRTKKIEDQKIILEKQAEELTEKNKQLEHRQKQIEQQKEELEIKNNEISKQRDELILLNGKVNEINQLQLRFFTNISHEFQTPLTLIISPIERLIKQLKSDEETLHLLSIINKNAHRLLMLIRQLLEIRKIETGNQTLQVELTETQPFLYDIFTSFDELAQKNQIEYVFDFQVTQSAWIDKEKLENVLYNLLSNAFKFTPNGHSIKFIALTEKTDNFDMLRISVADTGEGIAPHQIGKLFDRFLQVTDSKKHRKAGTGIGLSLVKSLVEIMYGAITVESEPGLGSTFTVNIPVSRNAFADHEIDTTGQIFESNIKSKVAMLFDKLHDPIPLVYESQEGFIEKILVVEDNPEMRSFICSSLALYYKVFEAENGLIGYDLAKKESPTLIISDIMMPELDGLGLCKKIKNNLYTSHIPIILLTAKTDIQDQIEGLEEGADDYITKPFNSEVLHAKIKSIIDNRNKLRAKFGQLEDIKPEELSMSNLDNKFFTKVTEIVDKFYTDSSFDVDQFASEMFVSRSQLYSKMKAITNLSANEYINTYRLKKSIELLTKGDLQISEVAYAVGFNDPKYFSRIFKKYYKQSPSDLIKKR